MNIVSQIEIGFRGHLNRIILLYSETIFIYVKIIFPNSHSFDLRRWQWEIIKSRGFFHLVLRTLGLINAWCRTKEMSFFDHTFEKNMYSGGFRINRINLSLFIHPLDAPIHLCGSLTKLLRIVDFLETLNCAQFCQSITLNDPHTHTAEA